MIICVEVLGGSSVVDVILITIVVVDDYIILIIKTPQRMRDFLITKFYILVFFFNSEVTKRANFPLNI